MADPMTELAFASIDQLAQAMADRSLDPLALTQMYLTRMKGAGRALNAYVAVREEPALTEAQASSARARRGQRLSVLDGIPVALKDNIDVAGSPTTNGLGGAPPIAAADAEVTARLKRAGAVILGKLNMHEAALGGTTDNPHHGRTFNPYRSGYSPGGSSGGSGAAVAAGLCVAALGTDTAGSIRLPASYCGIAGLKPSARRVSLHGIAPLNRRLDHAGPLARTVGDLAHMMAVLAEDVPTWTPQPVPSRLDGRTVAVLDNFLREAVVPEVAVSFDRAMRVLERLGARIVRTSLPDLDLESVRHVVFLMVEAGAALEHGQQYEREPHRFSNGLARCLIYGREMLAVQLLAEEARIAPAIRQVLACLAQADAIASPTTPQAAFSFGHKGLTNLNTYSTLANLTGCPAVSVPMGRGHGGLPHGLQLMGHVGQDEALLAIAGAYEAAAGVHLRPPVPFGTG